MGGKGNRRKHPRANARGSLRRYVHYGRIRGLTPAASLVGVCEGISALTCGDRGRRKKSLRIQKHLPTDVGGLPGGCGRGGVTRGAPTA